MDSTTSRNERITPGGPTRGTPERGSIHRIFPFPESFPFLLGFLFGRSITFLHLRALVAPESIDAHRAPVTVVTHLVPLRQGTLVGVSNRVRDEVALLDVLATRAYPSDNGLRLEAADLSVDSDAQTTVGKEAGGVAHLSHIKFQRGTYNVTGGVGPTNLHNHVATHKPELFRRVWVHSKSASTSRT